MDEGEVEGFRLGYRLPFFSQRLDFWRYIDLLAYAIKML
tara:strand:+ start:435 stop:551 length:117 start_codon:yes stop_codon:yes gene_type:complete